jgi:hypothetical protein
LNSISSWPGLSMGPTFWTPWTALLAIQSSFYIKSRSSAKSLLSRWCLHCSCFIRHRHLTPRWPPPLVLLSALLMGLVWVIFLASKIFFCISQSRR